MIRAYYYSFLDVIRHTYFVNFGNNNNNILVVAAIQSAMLLYHVIKFQQSPGPRENHNMNIFAQ